MNELKQIIKNHFTDEDIEMLRYHLAEYNKDIRGYNIAPFRAFDTIEKLLNIIDEVENK